MSIVTLELPQSFHFGVILSFIGLLGRNGFSWWADSWLSRYMLSFDFYGASFSLSVIRSIFFIGFGSWINFEDRKSVSQKDIETLFFELFEFKLKSWFSSLGVYDFLLGRGNKLLSLFELRLDFLSGYSIFWGFVLQVGRVG
jgi:hypothetical protein